MGSILSQDGLLLVSLDLSKICSLFRRVSLRNMDLDFCLISRVSEFLFNFLSGLCLILMLLRMSSC